MKVMGWVFHLGWCLGSIQNDFKNIGTNPDTKFKKVVLSLHDQGWAGVHQEVEDMEHEGEGRNRPQINEVAAHAPPTSI